jgi:hypothetical protein
VLGSLLNAAIGIIAHLDGLDAIIARAHCTGDCAADAAFDKNNDGSIARVDADLAVLEYWDAGRLLYICYEGAAIRPAPTCAGSTVFFIGPDGAIGRRDVNADGDALNEMAEVALGTCDAPPDAGDGPCADVELASCERASQCRFLSEDCLLPCEILVAAGSIASLAECDVAYNELGRVCWPRACGESGAGTPIARALRAGAFCGATPAFALESIEVNNQEALVQLRFNASQVAANVLDLHIAFDPKAVVLVDVRPLASLLDAQKDVMMTQPTPGDVRLMVLDKTSKDEIPYGALLQLYFQRIGPQQTKIGFSMNDQHQRYAIAPVQHESIDGSNQDLTADRWWSPPVDLPAASPEGTRIVLAYDFDNPGTPLSHQDTPSAETLCKAMGNGCGATAVDQARTRARLDRLQRGHVEVSRSIVGVRGGAVELDGAFDRIELPVFLSRAPAANPADPPRYKKDEQDYSLSAWFYSDGVSAQENRNKVQALWTHYGPERNAPASLGLRAGGAGTQLGLFVGDSMLQGGTGAMTEALGEPLAPRSWHHVGVAVDVASNTTVAQFYLDGALVGESRQAGMPFLQCPSWSDQSAAMSLHEDRYVGGERNDSAPDALFLATSQHGVYGVEEMGPSGRSLRTVLRDSGVGFRDPDYSPGSGKIAYVSNASGEDEIWIADSDGDRNSRRQVTKGFGSLALGVHARRPRIAPDGSALIFESNAFSTASDYNIFAEAVQLYYVPLDATTGRVRIPLQSGETTNVLDFDVLVRSGEIYEFRLTESDGRTHSHVRWLRGPRANNDRGHIVFTSASYWGDDSHVREMVLDARDLRQSASLRVPLHLFEDGEDATAERSLIDAYAALANGEIAKKHILYRRGAGVFMQSVLPPSDACNLLTYGDGVCNQDDAKVECHFDGGDCPNNAVAEPLAAVDKFLNVDAVMDAAFSPDGNQLMVAGTRDARPVLVRLNVSYTRGGLVDSAEPFDSPQLISSRPVRTQGIVWRSVQRFGACHWIGAYQDSRDQRLDFGLRGGLDEVRVHSYARAADAFEAEAARGRALLASDGRLVAAGDPNYTCNLGLDRECPALHQCVEQRCVLVGCEPQAAQPCPGGGHCTLRPAPVESEAGSAGGGSHAWVCANDCESTSECFSQECLNGPCRQCTDQRCIECTNDGGFAPARGCPDQNAWSCEEGSCMSECYDVADGESRYLCIPLLQACRRAKCETDAWSWRDLAPATFSGLGETRYRAPDVRYTRAHGQLVTVAVSAYGVGDYGHDPELWVEGKFPPVFGDEWFKVGRVKVRNKTRAEAEDTENQTVLQSPYAVTALRLRLVAGVYQNVTGKASGLLRVEEDGLRQKTAPHLAPGSRASLGYRGWVPEYEGQHDCHKRGATDCGERDNSDPLRRHLFGGMPGVVVLDVAVGGTLAKLTENTLCAERGGWTVYGEREASNARTHFGYDGFVLDRRDEGPAILNCPYAFNPSEHGSSGDVAMVMARYEVTTPPPRARIGAITELAYSCTVEIDRDRREPCYEWQSGNVSLDPLSSSRIQHSTLDFTDLRAFGVDAGNWSAE